MKSLIQTMGFEFMIEHIRSQNSKWSNPQGGLSIQGWGILNSTFKDFCRNVRLMENKADTIQNNGQLYYNVGTKEPQTMKSLAEITHSWIEEAGR